MAKKASKKAIALDTADLHLQDRAWADRPGLCGDAYFALDQIVNLAIYENLPVIAQGDLIDRQENEQRPIEFMCRQLDRMKKANCNWHYTQGQHERQPKPWLAVHPWPTWLEQQPSVLLGGHQLQGFDWAPADQVPQRLEAVDKGTEILAMHQVCADFVPTKVPELFFDHIPYAQLLLVGDYHKHLVLRTKGLQGQTVTVLSPGSTCMQAIDEEPVKHIYRIYDDLSFDSVPLKCRIMLNAPQIFDVESLEHFVTNVGEQLQQAWDTALTEGLAEEIQKPILAVPYNPLVPGALNRIRKAVGDRAHLFPDEKMPVTQAQEVKRVERQKIAAQGLVGCLDLLVNPKKEPEVYSYVRTLLESQENPQAVINAKRKEFQLDVRAPVDDGIVAED